MASVGISTPAPAAAASAPAAAAAANTTTADSTTSASTASASTATGRKLYVGNVEYQTTKADIKNLFKDYDVKDIEIPTSKFKHRGIKNGFGTRGYVFVEFGDDVDLDAVMEKFTDSEFKGRQIYLRYPKAKDDSSKEADGAASEEKKAESKKDSKKSKNSNVEKGVKKEKSTSSTKAEKSKPKPKKEEKEKIPFDQCEKLTDTLYLRNLDFTLKAKDIKEFFIKEGEKPEWATVPMMTIPPHVIKKLKAKGKPIEKKNKGYAFVKLNLAEGETIDDKVTKFSQKSLNDRELLVSVAVDTRHVKGEKTSEGNGEVVEDEDAPPNDA